ncbi:hypothetical protein EBI_26405 [Enterocytozoon bieneusi H348]|nr:hypothetical protein EBI_26405 [Enterocytozoon bieneusi H348]|eukprot:XP_001827877.1 hypothetical protein EBI_26405 [Enterocytozoon bieneusi H348]
MEQNFSKLLNENKLLRKKIEEYRLIEFKSKLYVPKSIELEYNDYTYPDLIKVIEKYVNKINELECDHINKELFEAKIMDQANEIFSLKNQLNAMTYNMEINKDIDKKIKLNVQNECNLSLLNDKPINMTSSVPFHNVAMLNDIQYHYNQLKEKYDKLKSELDNLNNNKIKIDQKIIEDLQHQVEILNIQLKETTVNLDKITKNYDHLNTKLHTVLEIIQIHIPTLSHAETSVSKILDNVKNIEHLYHAKKKENNELLLKIAKLNEIIEKYRKIKDKYVELLKKEPIAQ